MSALAPTMQAFFSERLMGQRQASPNTIAAYRDTFRLLLSSSSSRPPRRPASYTSSISTPT
jgi:integrase/recombinase XerD